MNKKPFIVAPGGSYEKAMVASAYGADEVYLGVPFTSLRMRQNKVRSFDELKKTVADLHAHGTRALLTMNIFPRNQDIAIFEAAVERIADVGADAIIFSDPGTFRTIRKYVPNMPLHLSTQTSTLNADSVAFWYDLGVKRVVLARELHIREIAAIKQKVPGVELEVFAHGAMCMSYSGRCLLGDYMSGRHANKGECSHACRFKYKVWLEEERRPGKMFQLANDENGSYILSSKDLCIIERLQEVLPYVDALKIEGRSKSEWYVGAVTRAYKHVRDSLLANKPIDSIIKNGVYDIPHRPYWDGFLFNAIQDYPEGEPTENTEQSSSEEVVNQTEQAEVSTTLTTSGPISDNTYFGVCEPELKEFDGVSYIKITPKQVMTLGMELSYLTSTSTSILTISAMRDPDGKSLEKATCNMPHIYLAASVPLKGWEILYSI